MKNHAQARTPTKQELESLVDYITTNRAFDPLDPTEEDGQIAEEKVARAHVAVFDGYRLEDGWPRITINKLLVVVWDDNPEHLQTFVFDRWEQVSPVTPDAEYDPRY